MLTKTAIEKYFMAEKGESLLFVIMGVAALIAAMVFFFVFKSSALRGAAIPFLLVGAIHMVVGYTVYKRSDEDRKRNVYNLDMNPSTFKTVELPRMQVVNKNFVIYRYTEIALAIVGIALWLLFRNNMRKEFWYGFGIALAVEALLSLGADFFAEKRAGVYTRQIESLIKEKNL
jgi:predicted membrane channel-forming protein YqfA (hemolysin III family)